MNKRKAKKMFITAYQVYERYEPAEGGYYVEERIPLYSVRGTLREIRKALKRAYGVTVDNRMETEYGYIAIERRAGQDKRIYKGYC